MIRAYSHKIKKNFIPANPHKYGLFDVSQKHFKKNLQKPIDTVRTVLYSKLTSNTEPQHKPIKLTAGKQRRPTN